MDIDSAAEAIDTIVQRAYCGESVGIAEITPILTQLIASERERIERGVLEWDFYKGQLADDEQEELKAIIEQQ